MDYPVYVSDGKLPCFYNGPAKNILSLGDKFKEVLTETCPQYLEGGVVCCDYAQLNALATQIKYPKQLFARCPACLKNFIKHFCATTCDPDQSLYMNPTTCLPGKTKDNISNLAVQNIDVFLTGEDAGDLYDSCDQVQYPQASNRVVDIMCGGTDTCNASLWLNYLGDPSQNHNSPFPMVYQINITNGTNNTLPEGVEPRDFSYLPCNVNDSQMRCSCADCDTADLCPEPPKVGKSHISAKVLFDSIVGVGVCLSVVMFVLAMVFGVLITCNRFGGGLLHVSNSDYGALKNEDDSPTSSVGSVNADEVGPVKVMPRLSRGSIFCMPCYKSGAYLENWIKMVFYSWGCIVAQFWPIVISVGIGLVTFVVLLTAVLHVTNTLPFTITTNPVELWSAPDSRARQEKDYFDKNFNPFYRTEMLIFTSDRKTFSFQPSGVYGVDSWTFGPVLTNEVLFEVML